MANPQRSSASDSDETRDIVQKKELEPYHERIKALEDRVLTNEQFATTFAMSSESQVKARSTVSAILIELIRSDSTVRKQIGDAVVTTDRNAVAKLMRRFGLGAWTLLVSILSGLAVYLITRH